jgi:hypothetical protein
MRHGPHHVAHKLTSITFPEKFASFIGSPLAALFSASRIGRGTIAREEFGLVGAEVRLSDDGSFELQLDTPNAESNPSEITVHATRSGVQNLVLITSFFLSDIATTTLLLFAEPERIQNHRHLTPLAHILD